MKESIIKAGEIAQKVKTFARKLIEKDMPLVEIADKIEAKIVELGGKVAFPTNLSINDIAAHFTPTADDTTLATGLLKIDLGVQVDGYTADTAFSLDLEDSDQNKKLIKAAEDALEKAIELVKSQKEKTKLNEIGKIIQQTIEEEELSPIINLSGHSIDEYDLHSGITIPNVDNKNTNEIEKGIRAIEPFATSGSGKVYDGKPSGIYVLQQPKNLRSPLAREVISYIMEEYQTLPFCERWIVNKFGARARLALKQLEDNESLHQFAQLIEASHEPVAQAEHTLLIDDKEVKVVS